MHSVEGLREGIRNCKRNVKTLQEAIVKEQLTMQSYKQMMRDISEADALKAEAQSHVEVVREDDGTD